MIAAPHDVSPTIAPPRLAGRRTADHRDGVLRCPYGHRIRARGMVMAFDGHTCDHVDPATARSCAASAFYVRSTKGTGYRLFGVECTKAELRAIAAEGMGPSVAVAWLGAVFPPDFAPRF